MSQTHRDRDEGTEREDDRPQRAPGFVDDQYQGHQKQAEERHETRRGGPGLALQPGIEPGRTDPPNHGEWSAGSFEGQNERVDCRQGAVAIGGRFQSQFQRDAEVVIAQKTRAAEQRRPSGKLAQRFSLLGSDFGGRDSTPVEIEQAVRLDLRNLGELPLQPVRGSQRGKVQWIRRFEHDQRLLALGEQTLELERGSCDGIAGHDESLDRRIVRHPQGAVYARCGQKQERARNDAPRSKYTEEELNYLGRSGHTHERARMIA